MMKQILVRNLVRFGTIALVAAGLWSPALSETIGYFEHNGINLEIDTNGTWIIADRTCTARVGTTSAGFCISPNFESEMTGDLSTRVQSGEVDIPIVFEIAAQEADVRQAPKLLARLLKDHLANGTIIEEGELDVGNGVWSYSSFDRATDSDFPAQVILLRSLGPFLISVRMGTTDGEGFDLYRFELIDLLNSFHMVEN